LLPLTAADAQCVVLYMRLVDFPRGWTLFREGDERSADYMLLLLEGEVSVDTGETGPNGAVPISVLGAGSVIGEMSLLDGAPRSASCHAQSAVRAAGLSRRGLQQLIDEHPAAGARLMIALAQRTAERLRALGQQLQMYAQLTARLQQQVAALQGRQP
jgi:CRP-like cAMP-binding protein